MVFNEKMPEEVAEHLDAVNKMAAMQRVDAILREKFARFSIEELRKGVEVDALVTVGGVHFYCRVKCPLMKPRFEPLEEDWAGLIDNSIYYATLNLMRVGTNDILEARRMTQFN